MMLTSWLSHWESSPGSLDCRTSRAPSGRYNSSLRPTNLGRESA